MKIMLPLAVFTVLCAGTSPALAQDNDASETPATLGSISDNPYAGSVYAGDYFSIGVGVAVGPSYAGSNDYKLSVAPILQGSWKGITLQPRPAGLALNFLRDPADGPGFELGVAMRLRSDRAERIKDPVVASLGELDRAVEVGPTAGVRFPQLLNPFDSLTVDSDLRWDVAGAHGGMVVEPRVTYFTPLNRAMAASLSVSTAWASRAFQDYYFRVTPAQSASTNGVLPAFDPGGGGFVSAGASILLALDLDGDVTNGGWSLVSVAGYSRMLGAARRTPFTSVRGSANQLLGVVGVGYTF